MITIFSHCRPFEGEFDAIQRAAIESWKSIFDAQVVIMGRGGSQAVAQELGVDYADGLRYNAYDTALVPSIFEAGEKAATNDIVCEISSDIILSANAAAVCALAADIERPFIVGRRTDIDDEGNDFFHATSAIDYFIYRRGTLGMIPDFAVGRTVYDQWLLWAARERWQLQTIDATEDLLALHYQHGYPEYGSLDKMRQSEERRINMDLGRSTGQEQWYCTTDTEYVMTGGVVSRRAQG